MNEIGYSKAQWDITARIEMSKQEGELLWKTTKHIPDFLLSEAQYGIISDKGACDIARRIIDPLGMIGDALIIRAQRLVF